MFKFLLAFALLFITSIQASLSYDLCVGFSANSTLIPMAAGASFTIAAALELCSKEITGCVAVSFDRVVMGDSDSGRCRFYSAIIAPSDFVARSNDSIDDFPVIMNVRPEHGPSSAHLPDSCSICSGLDCFPSSCPAGYAGMPSGHCTPCEKGTWSTDANRVDLCTACTANSCDPTTGESTTSRAIVTARYRSMAATASAIYKRDYAETVDAWKEKTGDAYEVARRQYELVVATTALQRRYDDL